MSEEDTKDTVAELLKELIHEVRGHGKPWYAKTPFKELLLHTATIFVAITLGWMLHATTGAPVTIEVAAGSKAAEPVAPVAAAPPETASAPYLITPSPETSASVVITVAAAEPSKKRAPVAAAPTAAATATATSAPTFDSE